MTLFGLNVRSCVTNTFPLRADLVPANNISELSFIRRMSFFVLEQQWLKIKGLSHAANKYIFPIFLRWLMSGAMDICQLFQLAAGRKTVFPELSFGVFVRSGSVEPRHMEY